MVLSHWLIGTTRDLTNPLRSICRAATATFLAPKKGSLRVRATKSSYQTEYSAVGFTLKHWGGGFLPMRRPGADRIAYRG